MSSTFDITHELAERLRAARHSAMLTQAEAAAKLEIPLRSYQDYEGGTAWPRPKRRRALLAWIVNLEASTEAVA